MNIETEYLDDHRVRLTVVAYPEIVEQTKRQTARKIAQKTRIPGFRPGKAPYHVIQRTFGDEAILDEGLESLVKNVYTQALAESGVQPYTAGELEDFDKNTLTMKFIIPLAPEVTLGDYRSIRIPYELEKISAEDIELVLQDLRERQTIEAPVDRPAQVSDKAYIRLTAHRTADVEGRDAAGMGAAIIPERQHVTLVVEEGDPRESQWPFAGFSQELIGLSAGEEKIIPHVYPQDSPYTALRGESVQFQVSVEEVKTTIVPELDDEFAQSLGEYETLDDLRADVRANLERQTLEAYNQRYDAEVVSRLLATTTVKYPPRMVDDEMDRIIANIEANLKDRNMDLETYLKSRSMERKDLEEELRPTAQDNLKLMLALRQVAVAENIQVDESMAQVMAREAYESVKHSIPEKDIRKISSDQLIQNLAANYSAEIQRTAASERLRSIAKGEVETAPEEVPAEEATSAEDASAEDASAEAVPDGTVEVSETAETFPEPPLPPEPEGDVPPQEE